jgi:hypothetical protein
VQAILTITASFVLTTVLGGLLGAYLQRRTWDHQNDVRVEESGLSRADEISHQVMRLLDKRLYRMLRLYVACRTGHADAVGQQSREERLHSYDAVLFEWNDQLNSTLALIGTYFGKAARDWLEAEIYLGFQRVGARLEDLYRLSIVDAERRGVEDEVRQGLNDLNHGVYSLGVFLAGQVLARQVGRQALHPVQSVQSPGEVGGRGIPLLSPKPPGHPAG